MLKTLVFKSPALLAARTLLDRSLRSIIWLEALTMLADYPINIFLKNF